MPAKKTATTKSTKGLHASAAPKRRPASAGDELVTMDRRRAGRDENSETTAPVATLERRQKVQRRRQIDPTTCERDYSIEEVEFMNAMDEYKRTSGRMFPTCSEVLEVIRAMGYVRLSPAGRAILTADADLTACDAVEPELATCGSL
jgi:hypothetical protein